MSQDEVLPSRFLNSRADPVSAATVLLSDAESKGGVSKRVDCSSDEKCSSVPMKWKVCRCSDTVGG